MFECVRTKIKKLKLKKGQQNKKLNIFVTNFIKEDCFLLFSKPMR